MFTPQDLVDLGTSKAVEMALTRLLDKQVIRKLTRGLYEYPRMHPDLGLLSPDPGKVAKAIAGKLGTRLQPSGAYAANLLGLSTQVPARIVYFTDGPDKMVRIGNQQIELRHTAPKKMSASSKASGLVMQALRYLGKRHVTPERIAHLKRTIPAEDRQQLLHELSVAPAWMRPMLRQIAEG